MKIDSIPNFIIGVIGLSYAIQHIFIFLVILWSPKLRENKTNQILLNLNVAYVITGLANFIPIVISAHLAFLQFPGYVYINTSLAVLSIDRVIFIKWPFYYQRFDWKFQFMLLLLMPISFVAPVTGTIISGSYNTQVVRNETAIRVKIFGTIAVMLTHGISNILIYFVLRGHKKAMKRLLQSRQTTTNPEPKTFRFTKKDILTFYTCFGCVTTYVFLWFPTLVANLIDYYGHYRVSVVVYKATIIFGNLNPISDGIIFAWFNRDFQLFIRRKFRRNTRVVERSARSSENTNVTKFECSSYGISRDTVLQNGTAHDSIANSTVIL